MAHLPRRANETAATTAQAPAGRAEGASRPRCLSRLSMTARYLAALSGIAGLALAAYLVLTGGIVDLQNLTGIINQTGRQRMLSQRIVAQCLLAAAARDEEERRDASAQLTRAIDDMAASQKALTSPEGLARMAGDDAALARRFYFDPPHGLDVKIAAFLDNARRFLTTPIARDVLEDEEFLAVLSLGERDILLEIDRLVDILQGQTASRIRLLQRIEAATLAATFLVLLLVGLWLFRPMVADILADREMLETLNLELERRASHDPLTGARNRLSFNEAIVAEIGRTRRYGDGFAVIMCDIDHFKRINDSHGHPAGDAILRELVAIFNLNLRATDILVRFGGEEFVILAPHADLSGAATLAEKLRQAVADHDFPEAIPVTISLGATQYQAGDTPESLISRADAALYAAKENGRNRVETG